MWSVAKPDRMTEQCVFWVLSALPGLNTQLKSPANCRCLQDGYIYVCFIYVCFVCLCRGLVEEQSGIHPERGEAANSHIHCPSAWLLGRSHVSHKHRYPFLAIFPFYFSILFSWLCILWPFYMAINAERSLTGRRTSALWQTELLTSVVVYTFTVLFISTSWENNVITWGDFSLVNVQHENNVYRKSLLLKNVIDWWIQ